MTIRFPKSVGESQRFVAWGFPALLVYGVVSLPFASWTGQVALFVELCIVVTGWQSFGVIDEAIYNDALFVTDLALLASYWLLMHYSTNLLPAVATFDTEIYNISGTVFVLYAVWDVTALKGRDTAAAATASHLLRFAFITFVVGLLFFLLGVLASSDIGSQAIGVHLLRIVALSLWIVVLVWWQIGRFIAALKDS